MKYHLIIWNEIPPNFIVSLGLPIVVNNCIYNATAILHTGTSFNFILKKHLANDGNYYESRWFKSWDHNKLLSYKVDGVEHIVGDFIINAGGIKIGVEQCEESFIANRSESELSKNAVDIILNPSGSHFAFGKHQVRKNIVVDGSRAFGCSYIYSNLLGCNGELIFDGDCFIAQSGDLLSVGKRFSYNDYELITSIIDIDKSRTHQLMNGSFRQENTKYISNIDFNFKNVIKENYDNVLNKVKEIKFEEFSEAITLGLYDYMRKSHSNGYIVSLSGGADSAACACLVDLMAKKTKQQTKNILTTVYQATQNSSEQTKSAAKKLSNFINSVHYEWNINEINNNYIKIAEDSIGKKITWEENDIALQNIQARVRVPGILILSNINNQILLCTSNKSEAAVGYSSFGGDALGGIAPISGIDKPFILQWLNYLYKECNYLGLENIIKQKPTAELRPGNQQLDEEELAPYNVLNEIELAAIVDKKFPKDVLLTIIEQFPKYTKDQLKEWTRKFFKLFIKNQWKRELMPPGFYLGADCMSPKSWLRLPVLCGNMEEYLIEMDKV